ncbi:UNVERIFIED_CONTAM: hypothetical protein Scaly_0009800 [Sesamum calycinum]|uniref:RNase H type-1 domain-containing protein n=1 Tax=Sesamum calycinum TaxID=2727403 RepID=A0AAW2SU49_9LAMI
MHVARLLDPIGGDWNVGKVRELFWRLDSELILDIPLNRTGEQDLWVWHYSATGTFTIRSAYHLACSLEDRPGVARLGSRTNGGRGNRGSPFSPTRLGPSISPGWQAPAVGVIKLNFDGAILSGGRVLGVGVAARDDTGQCVA